MPERFSALRKLLNVFEGPSTAGQVDLTVDDQVHFNTPGFERARIKKLRALVSDTLAWDGAARQQLGAEVARLTREMAQAQTELGQAEPRTGADQLLLEQTLTATQAMAEGLAQMQACLDGHGEPLLAAGLDQVEQAVRQIDELLSPSALTLGGSSGGTDISA